MLPPDGILSLAPLLLVFIPLIRAQGGLMFEWGFAEGWVSSSLASCRTFPITADPVIAHGTPPFYMMAFAVGGTPTTTFIGTNESHLAWSVHHPIGTQLVLGVVDSNGHSGGIDKPLYTVTEGSTTECLPEAATEPVFKISANVTDALDTCEPWGLTIEGGAPPYTLTLAALNSPDVRNITLGPNDTVYTYINRADPGTHMIASASDRNGRWATGSPLVRTQGSADVNCLGLVSSSSNGTSIAQRAPSSQSMSRRTRIAIIVAAAMGSLLLCGLGICAMQCRRWLHSRHQTTHIAPFRTFSSDCSSDARFTVAASFPAVPIKSQSISHTRNRWATFVTQFPRPPPGPLAVSLRDLNGLPPPYADTIAQNRCSLL
ncbi:hypothetical protein B0H17DRAFT_168797 [Mycena rosella]|uniref:Uncharacterized protein n=1 Tax=Mycena rosella TaxID=1033263 RepID=A0AAD7D122_MYCRO|nr:hypothetical protein B0H17DRAFT_168797 [Mycena rosella]